MGIIAVLVILHIFFFGFPASDKIEGRFFAANELKLALAYIVLHYDVKLGNNCNGMKPKNLWLSIALIPDKHAHILFWKRRDLEIGF
ncbi:hypothetical protein H2248_005869 [Termitomyces sp. 'cryptogamus']|nr:hypothetical protein H2248_005869 [Termitomyces sp. 'cryptogamus']